MKWIFLAYCTGFPQKLTECPCRKIYPRILVHKVLEFSLFWCQYCILPVLLKVSSVPLPCAVEELSDAHSFLHEFELQISAYTRPLNNMSLNCRNPQYIVYHCTTNSWLNLPSIPRFLTAQRVGIPTPLFLRVSCIHFMLWYMLSISCQIVRIKILNATGFEFGIWPQKLKVYMDLTFCHNKMPLFSDHNLGPC